MKSHLGDFYKYQTIFFTGKFINLLVKIQSFLILNIFLFKILINLNVKINFTILITIIFIFANVFSKLKSALPRRSVTLLNPDHHPSQKRKKINRTNEFSLWLCPQLVLTSQFSLTLNFFRFQNCGLSLFDYDILISMLGYFLNFFCENKIYPQNLKFL